MENPSSVMSSPRVNFEFAFNDVDFSDRVLHIEIIEDDSFDSKSDSERCRSNDSESCTVCKVKTINISSLLLAGNSPFFHKLFKNGMSESKQRDATLRISASEEAGVMEVLNFMYTNTLTATSTPDLLGVLVAADKFEARDCVRYCTMLLQKIPMSLEYALLYLELPPSVSMNEQVQPLMDAANKCLLAHYEDISRLPLSAFVLLLRSDKLQVNLSGDSVYEIILKWARAHYPELDKRREILAKNLIQFIPFRNMSSSKLRQVLVCPDLDGEEVSKLMLEAFIMAVDDPFGHSIHASNEYRVVKVEQYKPRCVVYFDIKREDWVNISPSRFLNSQSFRLGGRSFYLSAQYNKEKSSVGLFLYMNKGSQNCSVEFEFEAMSKSSMKFQNMLKAKVEFSDVVLSWGFPNLFNTRWTDFMSKDREYFIDGILHLRADLTMTSTKA